jgi:hypothetical protein
VRNPLAGKKAKLLYRNPDKSVVLQVEDPHDEILVTVEPDGTMFEERWSGVAGVREAWEAAAPRSGAMLVPDDSGQKVWTHLEPEPEPGPELEPVAEPARAITPIRTDPAPGPAPVGFVDSSEMLDPASVPGTPEHRSYMRWLSS